MGVCRVGRKMAKLIEIRARCLTWLGLSGRRSEIGITARQRGCGTWRVIGGQLCCQLMH